MLTAVLGVLVIALVGVMPVTINRVVPRIWAKAALWTIPAKPDITGLASLDTSQPYVIVVNHISQVDILVLYGWLPLDLKWVMKQELRKVPVIGWACASMGHIFIDRANRSQAAKTLQEMKAKMTSGQSVLFFPEGTRSRNGEVLAFKKGAFVTAKDLDVAILPITISGTDKILRSDTFDLQPGCANMVIHHPIGLDIVRTKSADELSMMAKACIQNELNSKEGVPECIPV
ncbi:MAG: lysophospholipid acyltransferase family protein [Pseudomonadales bacterium]